MFQGIIDWLEQEVNIIEKEVAEKKYSHFESEKCRYTIQIEKFYNTIDCSFDKRYRVFCSRKGESWFTDLATTDSEFKIDLLTAIENKSIKKVYR